MMVSRQQYHDQLISSMHSPMPELKALLAALPCYGDHQAESAHRGVLRTLLQTNLRNERIAPQPDDSGFGYFTSYSYEGPYAGYADAFFPGRTATAASAAVAAAVGQRNAALNQGWWQFYAQVVASDAARQAASLSLDTSKLSSELTGMHQQFLPALTASYLATLQNAYQPTAGALRALSGQLSQACTELRSALAASAFTANVNQSIAMGGDSTNATVWLLYNMWVVLMALGCRDVDGQIQALQAGGLTVPGQIGPGNWCNGGYSTWYTPLCGGDAGGSFTAAMPELAMTSYSSRPPMPPVSSHVTTVNGYAQSFCLWGPLNRYRPQSSSCLGAGTGVLMADGSATAIENIAIGDWVMSDGGAGKVVLVERPRRLGRPLYRVNGLNVFATSGHPFRAVDGPKRRAVDPWHLIDSVPTMTGDGVGSLVAGVSLVGQGARSVVVKEVLPHGPGEDDEVVYDLVVDNGDRGHAVYYVGGPDIFLAVDSETADPLYDTASTLAVAAAMDVALDSVREHFTDPHATLPDKLGCVDLTGVHDTEHAVTPRIPDTTYYLRNGEWDRHASALETHLVRQYGRMFRRHAATSCTADKAGFVVCLQDIELIGDIPAGPHVEVELGVRGPGTTETVRLTTLPHRKSSYWHMTPDVTVDFGPVPAEGTLAGTVFIGRIPARFRAPISPATVEAGTIEHYLYDPAGQVVGRIAIDQHQAAPRTGRTRRDGQSAAISVGRELGLRLAAHHP